MQKENPPSDTTKGHRWSGWPGAWCLDCGMSDPIEQAIADGHGFDDNGEPIPIPAGYHVGNCPEPGSKRHDPYARSAESV